MKRRAIPLREHNLREQLEIFTSPLNYWGTGQDIGHQPNPSDETDRNALFMHWIRNGGREEFKERFEIRIPLWLKIRMALREYANWLRSVLSIKIKAKQPVQVTICS
jgi:hypothetical protein